MRILAPLAALLALSASACATVPQPAASTAAAVDHRAFVIAANPLAARAGVEVLDRGGSATDAAAAVQAMLSLVEPQSSGVGGGAFMSYYDAGSRAVTVYDGREVAPAQATPNMFVGSDGKPLAFGVAVLSGRATGVPGAVALLAEAQREHGKLAWSSLFGSAERTASEGFIVSPRLGRLIAGDFVENGAADVIAYFRNADGTRMKAGDRLRNPAYADFLRRLAAQGPSALYRGSTAIRIIARTHEGALPGSMTMADLAAYRPVKRQALCRPYRAYRVCAPPPPASGVGILELLGILERTDIASRGRSDPQAWLTFAEAMRRYGSDKPDRRFELELTDVLDIFAHSDFNVFKKLGETPGNRVAAVRYPGGAALSRRDFDALAETAKSFGASGLAYLTFTAEGTKGSIVKFVGDEIAAQLRAATGAVDGDALVFVGEKYARASDIAGRLRLEIGERLKLRDPKKFAFCWVYGFPLFEADPETAEITFSHHPFTAPAPGQEELFDTDPLAVRAQHYDLVLNGFELGSGSIRNHTEAFQRKVFHRLGLDDATIEDRFGFFMEALRFGAPPHGGMALGVDRIAMLACGETSIRDVIAFPKNQMARDVMMDAPSRVPDAALRDLGLRIESKPTATQ